MSTVIYSGTFGTISITSNIKRVLPRLFARFQKLVKEHTTFLVDNKHRIDTETGRIVKNAVYKVPFKPRFYRRTYRLLQSITSTVRVYRRPRSVMTIFSDSSVAPALYAPGGYPKFVAGEGARATDIYKIGFLRTKYGDRASYFPRRFHVAVEEMLPDILVDLYTRKVLRGL